MMAWSNYLDESYNARTFCVGGWLATVDTWAKIEKSWKAKIDHENRISLKRGCSPISRYHATDCANLKREFDEHNGWSQARQIQLSKKLCGIIAAHAPSGVVIGGGVEDFKQFFPTEQDTFRRGLYHMSFGMYLLHVAEIMKHGYPEDRVTVFYDRSKEFGFVAQRLFEQFMNDPSMKDLSSYFVTMAPMGWEDCVPLQPADMLAYEGMKRLDLKTQGKDQVRKALRAILGKRTPLAIGSYTRDHYVELQRIINERRVSNLS